MNVSNCLKKNKSNITFTILITIILINIKNSISQQIKDCHKEYFLCNNHKCSKYSFCNYKTKIETSEININYSAECICVPGYDTVIDQETTNNQITECCYKLKELYLAFLYEIFIGFGFGYFYLEDYNLFFIKFTIQITICCVVLFSGYFLNFEINKTKKNKEIYSSIYRSCNIFNFILIGIFIIWKIIDFFIFGLNLVQDINGMRLYNEW